MSGHSFVRACVAAVGLVILCGCGGVAARPEAGATLRSRVAPPEAAVIEAYREAGAPEAKAHTLTDTEWAMVNAALDDLPPLYREILQQRLVRLSFVDAPLGAGTALTRDLDPDGPERRFDMTLRADVLEKSLTDFLNEKEARLFETDAYSVHIDAGDARALPYILLHEATHVVDRTLGLTAQADGPFRSGVWRELRDLTPPLDSSPVARTVFRRAPKLPLSEAPELYSALCESPFASLYATASAGEDVAELFAWRQLSRRFGVRLQIEVRDAQGRVVYRCMPLQSPLVRRRFRDVDRVLARR